MTTSWDAEEQEGAGAEAPPERGSRRGRMVATALIVLALVLGLVAVLATSEPAANRIASSPLVGQPAPAVVGTTLDSSEFDLADAAGVAKGIDAADPDIVVNAAAYTNVDRAESDEETAFAVNATGAECVARA